MASIQDDEQTRRELRARITHIVDEVLHHARRPTTADRALGSDSRLAVAALIDHTLLKPDATRADIEQLCREALDLGFAAVCINPAWVRLAADRVGRSRVAVCAVIGFPFGANTPDAKAFEARRALFDGARELDMVMNIGALKSGDLGLVQRDIEAVAVPVREAGGLSKVIIEASLLTDEEKIAACTLARAAGADYVKTSTGFGPGGATAADVALMRRTVGPDMGVKAAGGIGSYRAAREMIAAGATRIGSSAGVRIVREAQDASVSQSGSSSY